jgi:hypothetical protein
MKFKKALLASASILFCVAALAQNLPSPSYKNLSVNGLTTISDTGRSGNDNTPSINLNASEALNYTASYATHYGFNLSATQLSGGTGDRIGLGVTQTCNATLSGKSCVGEAPLAVAAGTARIRAFWFPRRLPAQSARQSDKRLTLKRIARF